MTTYSYSELKIVPSLSRSLKTLFEHIKKCLYTVGLFLEALFSSKGGVKVLVTGPWYSSTSPYTVLFDGVPTPTTLVQAGVLRCYCPGMFLLGFFSLRFMT